MNNLFAIFIGGGLGSILRYSLSYWIKTPINTFPLPTFLANILAGLILGVFSGIILEKFGDTHWLRYLIVIGLCGGFSTFSTFSMESLSLLQNNQFILAGTYILSSIVCCIAAILLGVQIAKIF